MKIHYKKLREGDSLFWLLLDGLMLFLISINLIWMIFDFSFNAKFLQVFLEKVVPDFFYFYRDVVHPDFLLYDFGFVVIFLLEFLFRWIVAIVKKVHPFWASFVFVNWYDLLGCVPIASFRFLRLFRIVSLIVRLQQKGVIDVTDTWWFKYGSKNYQRVIEEISDRVSVNILTGIQKELKYQDDTVKAIIEHVIIPNKIDLSDWLASRLRYAVEETYTLHKEEIKLYLEQIIDKSVKNNPEINRLEAIPVIGKQISKALSSSISDISYSVINNLMNDLSGEKSNEIMLNFVDISINTTLLETDQEKIEKISKMIVNDSIEVMKKQVSKKHYDKE